MDPFDLRLWKGFVRAGGNPSENAIVEQITIDSRRLNASHSLFVPLQGQQFDGHKFISHAAESGASFALVKKGWKTDINLRKLKLLEVDDPLHALQEIAKAYRQQFCCKVIMIMGSYGKTMVKDLLEAMLSTKFSVIASPESFNSQIGVALSLLNIGKEHELALIEAGISKQNEMTILSDIIASDCAILTHIGKKHLVTLGDLDTVAREMCKSLYASPKKAWVIFPEDPHILALLPELRQSMPNTAFHFWSKMSHNLPHAEFKSDERGAEMTYTVTFPDQVYYEGRITSGFYYFLDLINITVKAAWLLGLESEAIEDILRNYSPEPMRTEIWKSSNGITFINDTYCSDPQSLDHAFKYFQQTSPSQRKVFIFGGMRGKHRHLEIDFKKIAKSIYRTQIDLLLLFGKHNFFPLINEIKEASPLTEVLLFESYQEALSSLKLHILENDAVLIKGDSKHSLDSIVEAFNDSIYSNQCIINLAAIAENIGTIRKKLPVKTRLMVMVKALAYGTDEIRMAKFLENCQIDILGVSYVDEGITLKRGGASQSIFVINAAIYEIVKIVKWNLEVGVSESTIIEALGQRAKKENKKIKVHLHVDTGMGRFGCRPEETLQLAKLICENPSLEFEGLMTHLACADDPFEDEFTLKQVGLFEQVIDELTLHNLNPNWVHAANSSGAIRFNFPRFNMVRVGLSIYGLYSSVDTKKALELRLALSLISRIVAINRCKQGENVSYGRNYSSQKLEERIAVLPIGYFDGLHRNYSGKAAVIIRGQKAPMVGNICMDFMMVDVTNIPNAVPGDSVLVFGEDEYGHYLSPEELANRGDSIIHELITCLGPRIQRIFVYEEARRVH